MDNNEELPIGSIVCPHCADTGWKPAETHGAHCVERCDCWRVRLRREHLAQANIQDSDRHCFLQNFLAYNESLERAVAAARRLAETFPPGNKGLFLQGRPGSGKTHLAVAVLKRIIERTGARGRFHTTSDLLKRLRNTYDPSVAVTEMGILEPVLTAQVVVLDDLGAEKPSAWVLETLDYLIDTRYRHCRLTLFTSNIHDTENRSDPDSLVARIGERSYSRLHEMCEFIELDGADYRKRPPNAGPDDLVTMWKRDKLDKSRSALPWPRFGRPARAELRDDHRADLKWPGGRGGS
jgi:DNA replication protein DnaC